MFFNRLFLAKYLKKKIGGHGARLREKDNLLRFARARARVRALMTRNSYAVGMRNAIPRNYLNLEALSIRYHLNSISAVVQQAPINAVTSTSTSVHSLSSVASTAQKCQKTW